MRHVFSNIFVAVAVVLGGSWSAVCEAQQPVQKDKAEPTRKKTEAPDAKDRDDVERLRQEYELSKLKGLGVLAEELEAAGKVKVDMRAKAQDEVVNALIKQVEEMKRQLSEREGRLAGVARQIAERERDRSLPPIQDGEIKVFHLMHAPSRDAARTVESLFGSQGLRIAVDERTNTLIAFGKPDSLAVVDALLQRVDAQGRSSESDRHPPANRSVLLKVYWLADNVTGRDGFNADEFLLDNVLTAVDKLGIAGPMLIAQTVTALSVGSKDTVEFSNETPAVINGQPVSLHTTGGIRFLADGEDRAELMMKVQVSSPGTQCLMQGSLATPLGHYMVLGTTNSLRADAATAQVMAFQQGGMLPGGMLPGGMLPGGMAMGRGESGRAMMGGRSAGRFGDPPAGRGGEFAGPAGAGPEGMMPGAEAPAQPKLDTSRFAFVVQVVPAESYPADDAAKKPRPEDSRGR